MDCDYAMLIKLYGQAGVDTRYSPLEVIGIETKVMCGNPDPKHISRSFVERQNLTMRTSMRRFTRFTNAFSKKLENHEAAIALHYMHYNFCRIQKNPTMLSQGLVDFIDGQLAAILCLSGCAALVVGGIWSIAHRWAVCGI